MENHLSKDQDKFYWDDEELEKAHGEIMTDVSIETMEPLLKKDVDKQVKRINKIVSSLTQKGYNVKVSAQTYVTPIEKFNIVLGEYEFCPGSPGNVILTH